MIYQLVARMTSCTPCTIDHTQPTKNTKHISHIMARHIKPSMALSHVTHAMSSVSGSEGFGRADADERSNLSKKEGR